jgi:hypothetical protein
VEEGENEFGTKRLREGDSKVESYTIVFEILKLGSIIK